MVTTRKKLMPFGAGDYVVAKVDERHAGRVNYVEGLPGVYTVKIKWLGSGWLSEFPAGALRKITREEALERP